jgi:tRNA-dihydrouridine synthase C
MSRIDWQRFWQDQDRILLAPMEGVVDAVMRDLISSIGGVDLCVTEFVRVTDRLLPLSDYKKYCPELFATRPSHTANGTPILVQFLGGKAGPIAENAAFAASLGAVGIDLNFGCPAKTVNRHDGGATLLKNPERIHEIVSAVRKATPLEIPVSAKVRLGFDHKDAHLEIAQAAESGGAAWLTVHARTRDEGYRPPAHWEYIARMREAIKIPVIANGEIWSIEDYEKCRSVSGCRHVMMGRGLMARPALARMCRVSQPQNQAATEAETLQWLHRFAHASLVYRHEDYAVARLKQWLKSLSIHNENLKTIFEEVKRYENLAPMLAAIDKNNSLKPH